MTDSVHYGGIEGGATHTNLVICDALGAVVGRAQGPGTNHWTLGMDECVRRLLALVHTGKRHAGLDLQTPLHSLGLTLSGCEQESSNEELASRLRKADPDCALHLYVASDTAGSLATAAPDGGLVLIAGTGSNALLQNPSGQKFGCGGWGYLLGDEGAAYWIAFRAVKTVFDEMDGLARSEHDVARVWALAQEHFAVADRADLLPHCYKYFDKSAFAGLTAKLADLASEGDALSLHLFEQAGRQLGAHVAALAPRADPALRPLRVVCVGSVFRSWDLLRSGVVRQMRQRGVDVALELVKLRVSSAMGAAWLAAKHARRHMPRDDAAHCEVFFKYEPCERVDTNGDAC